jgi:hypothetical protein
MVFNAPPLQPPRRRSRTKRRPAPPTPPAQELILESADLTQEDPESLILTFDRAIDMAGYDGSAVIVNDGSYVGMVYSATGPVTMLSPTSVNIELVAISEDYGPGVTLNAPATTGIVAVDDGGTWGGATAVELPFP